MCFLMHFEFCTNEQLLPIQNYFLKNGCRDIIHWPWECGAWPGKSRGWAGRIRTPPSMPVFLRELTLDFVALRGLGPVLTLRESLIPMAQCLSV